LRVCNASNAAPALCISVWCNTISCALRGLWFGDGRQCASGLRTGALVQPINDSGPIETPCGRG
jgi:hypothetical protein